MEQEGIKAQLMMHDILVIEANLPYIQRLLHTTREAHAPVEAYTNLHKEVPLLVVDPEVIQFD